MLKKSGKVLALLVVLSLPVIFWTQRWNIYDAARLRGYTAPKDIAQLATDTSMNNKTRRLFYVYHPELDDKTSFNNHCSSSEQTIVLGCYIEGQGIYLYNITDQRLNGVIQVTAAHETLHAAYGRLSASEKEHVNDMITSAYAKVTDQRIRSTIDDYKKKGADTTNELHSILGTEVRALPADLEAYYSRYFTDRKKIVTYSEQYENVFAERKNKVAEDDKQLATMKEQIENGEAQLDSQEKALDAERSRLDALLAAKQYQQYNAGVPGFNAMVSKYNNQVAYIRGLIDDYNKLVAERNALVTEEDQLVKAIDSRPETVKTQ